MQAPRCSSPGPSLRRVPCTGLIQRRVARSRVGRLFLCSRSAAQASSEPELAGPFEFPALPSVVSRTADDEQYHGARRWPENQQAS